MLLCLRRARAIEISCRWPALKLAPLADTWVSRSMDALSSCGVADPGLVGDPVESPLTTEGGRVDLREECVVSEINWTRNNASRHSSSLCSENGSKFSLKGFSFTRVGTMDALTELYQRIGRYLAVL